MQNRKTACFTGHRDIIHNDIEKRIKTALLNLIENGFIYFVVGGAKGFDTLVSEQVIELKSKFLLIQLIVIYPFKNQYIYEKNWTDDEIFKYNVIKDLATYKIELQDKYSRGRYYRRNRYMVDISSICVCYQYKNNSGTSYTSTYAKNKGLKIINCAEE